MKVHFAARHWSEGEFGIVNACLDSGPRLWGFPEMAHYCSETSGGRHLRFVPVVIAISACLAGCNATKPPLIGAASSAPAPQLGQAGYSQELSDYILRPADVISLTVFREPALSLANVAVAADGGLSVPLVGSVRAEGLTPAQLGEEIRRRLGGGYLRNPQVSINVVEYASHQVTVEGAVEKPGVYKFAPGSRLSSAIALASGPKRVARKSQVAVFRQVAGGIEIAKFDYGEMQRGAMLDPVLRPGDRVVVGTSGLAQFWQDLLQALPAFGLFTRL